MTTEKKHLLDKTFQSFMELGLSGENIGSLDDMVAKDVVGFGTTIDEKIFGVKDLQDLLIRQKEQSAGMEMNWKPNILDIHISSDENTAIYTNDLTLYITLDGNTIEMYMRFSVVLEYVQQKWLVVHWHGSKPEHVKSEKDTWGVQSWKEKAEALEMIVSERTADLVEKNRELEIETALEKVRSVSLAMNASRDLSKVVYVVFTELVKLDAQLDRCLILIVNPQTLGITWYITGKEGLLSNNGFLVPDNTHPSHQAYLEGWRTKRKKWHYLLAGDEKKVGDAYVFSQTGLANLPDVIKADMAAVEAIHLTISSEDFGCLIASSLSPLSDAHASIVERFTIVFNQTYIRFIDLQKAEAQAREAQIEAALERVRSSSLAMHRSEELQGVVNTVVEQLKELNIESDTTNIMIFNSTLNSVELWTGSISTGKQLNSSWHVSHTENNILKDIRQAQQNGEEVYLKYLSFKEKNNFFEYLFVNTDFKKLNPERKKFILESKRASILGALVKDIGIQIISYSRLSFLPEEISVLKRSAKVFEQAYTRFLDLQKAEAQAREAQIQLALERVRARTMAMQHSDELPEAATILFQQVQSLGMPAWSTGYCIWNEDQSAITLRMSSESVLQLPFTAPTTEDELFMEMHKGHSAGKSFHVVEMGGDKLAKHYEYMRTLPVVGDILDSIIATGYALPGFQIMHHAYFSKGFLLFITYEPVPDAHEIFQRFAKVFEQTYTRFLDLQKAEAQVREAQIEAALERVRSKTMAMHKSEQLPETAQVLFEQFAELGKIPDRISIGIIKEELQVIEWWATDQMGRQLARNFDASILQPTIGEIFTAWKEGKESIMVDLSGDALKEWVAYVRDVVKMPINDSKMKGRRVHHGAFFSQGLLLISAHEPMPNEIMLLLIRFANVFSQTYTRFLDLQKAEAQAREAQIEASLERVRAKTMAMHSSEDVGTAITTLFTELDRQHIENVRCGIAIIDTNQTMEVWSVTNVEDARPEERVGQERMVKAAGTLDMNAHKLWQLIYDNWKNKIEFLYYHLFGKEKQDYIDIINTTPGYLSQPILEMPDMHCQVYFFNEGAIWAYSLQPHTDQQRQVMNRFTTVFSQTFLRYRDLQKAEAQAREAQIEAALERVRSRSMAMHNSDELLEAGEIIFVEMQKLGIESLTAGFVLMDKEEKNGLNYTPHPGTKKIMPVPVIVPHNETIHMQMVIENWKNGKPFLIIEMDEIETIKHQTFIAERSTHFPLTAAGLIAISPARLVLHNFYFKEGYVLIVEGKKLSVEQTEIMLRFAKVFQQTYTRFLDLQKAEAQAREAQIELSLERVRAKTMAMHNSADVAETVAAMFDELIHLGVDKNARCGIGIIDDVMKMETWTAFANLQENVGLIVGTLDMSLHPMLQGVYYAWKNGETQSGYTLEGEDKKDYYRAINSMDYPVKFDLDNLPDIHYQNAFYFYEGIIYIFSIEILPAETGEIIKRFAKVFGQTYRRYLDLQRAEAQAREAQLEAALERVRSRTMAMRKSEELLDVASILFQQVKALGVPQWNCGFNIWEIGADTFIYYPGTPDGIISQSPCTIPLTEHPVFQRFDASRRRGDDLLIYEKQGEEQVGHYQYMLSLPGVGDLLQSMLDAGFEFPVFQIDHIANFAYGNLIFITYEHFPEMHDVFKRFAKVFEQTYTRFLDLQKAEAQTREAQIEAALERVRSRSMAMHKSDELRSVVNTLYGELQSLQVNFQVVGIQLLRDQSMDIHMWLSTADGLYDNIIHWPFTDLPVFHEIYKARTTGDMLKYTMFETTTQEFFEEYFKLEGVPQARRMALQNVKLIDTAGAYQQLTGIFLMRYTEGSFSSYEEDIIKRFSKVFEQTYTRFLDIQKAEAQTRESKVEAALEKVRSRTMGMQSSDELPEVANLLFTEVRALGIHAWSCGYNILAEDKKSATCFMSSEGALQTPFQLRLWGEASFDEMGDFVRSEENMLIQELDGKSLLAHYAYMKSFPDLKPTFDEIDRLGLSLPTYQINHLCKFTQGFILFITYEKVPDAHEIFKRFTSVFDQTYTRFLDLKKAEAQALEATKRASVDRVRAEIASMRTTIDLERIQPLIWNELKTLGVPFIRCGVFIIDEVKQELQAFLSTPDGKSIAAFHLPYHSTDQSMQIVAHWQQKKIFKDHMDEKAFADYTKNLVQQGAVASDEKYVTENRPTDLYLHFLPFLQGMLYVGNDAPLNDDELQLVQNLADAFSTAYARYEDFNKLDLAKTAVESAMSELKATQSQLVQQEKLASLGQLTAGIAHEIKNPLNFVNNFSEVSIELIDEVMQEIEKNQDTRDETLISDILKDIRSNVQKVHDHGYRANSIVTSMLQHSRGGTGSRYPTDLNALIKEYVNLSYHGMRASKTPIDVDIELNLYPALGMVSLIKEDFTRVVINLSNNAFDAMREKVKAKYEVRNTKYEGENTKYDIQSTKYEVGEENRVDYKPNLSIQTRLENGKVLIQFKDNGPGIPDEIKDKILQPFFTTKKGTEGTGLGLSITNDIVKAHGGELKVETKEGEGSVFIIQLPIN